MKRLNFKNIVNIRDLGGYNKNGLETKYNVFIRSNIVSSLEENEVQYLLDNNIKTIIDLRDDEEISKKSSFFSNDKRFTYYNISLKGKNIPKREKDIPVIYMEIIDDKEKIKTIMNIILKSECGMLFHCTAGKDRTGVIAMLLLKLANVKDDDIVVDYAASDIYLREEMNEFRAKNPKLPKFLGRAKPQYMKKTLELFSKKYQTIDNYFKYLGFNNQEIKILKSKL